MSESERMDISEVSDQVSPVSDQVSCEFKKNAEMNLFQDNRNPLYRYITHICFKFILCYAKKISHLHFDKYNVPFDVSYILLTLYCIF